MSKDERKICKQFLRDLKGKGKKYPKFDESFSILKNYVASNGLEDEDINELADVIMTVDMGANRLVPLIMCLVPKYKVPEDTVKSIIAWVLARIYELSVNVSTIVIQWIIGILDHHLVDRKVVNIYYYVFFHVMLKKERVGKHIARLVYILAKPEDVTRRDVSRLLAVQQQSVRSLNHFTALLSLFKSYKPELVPERIQSVNIGSVWRDIPEALQSLLENVRARSEVSLTEDKKCFNWNTFQLKKTKKNVAPLLPSVGYFQVGSNIFEEQDTRSIFDITSLEDLGKLHLSVKLPSSAVSLLSNTAGHHLLTFANVQYQSRFAFNLYCTLQTGFILEPETVSPEETNKLLDMTIEFSRYMQQSVPTVNRFIHEYLYHNMGEYQSQLLALMEWMTSVSSSDLQENLLIHLRSMFYQSSVTGKCEIIRSLKGLLTNLFVSEAFGEQCQQIPFLGQAPMTNLEEIIPILMKAAQDLIVSGLNIHSYNILLLSEALSFYEQICILESHSRNSFFTLAPSAVIYGSFVTNNCAILSRICKLLLRYRDRSLKYSLNDDAMAQVKSTIIDLASCIQDVVEALFHDEVFKTRSKRYFLNNISKEVMEDLRSYQLNCLLNITNHCAILPYKCMLSMNGIEIDSKEDATRYIANYYPDILRLFTTFEK
ncbi:uncharacterized protein LOC108623149 [Ceratina calcarata]|uniref:Uncharacterized protein LOC108623149 n=1 Tax=Ceratina calcarata TaxID=156304 RepID=A0AAJ7N4U8_9HYME|nr:uncharacterized protein LOC108623149 [Ceratina calcarata]